jgi:imidazoleglycerol phosphate dehydratase HisB
MNICSSDDDVQMMMRNTNETKLELGVGKGYIKLVSNINTWPHCLYNLTKHTHIFIQFDI